jgi:hypothetical protein
MALAVVFAAACAACGGGDRPPQPVAARDFADPGFVASSTHEVRYGTLLASEMPASVAAAYGIVRSPDRVVVNVSVLRRVAGSVAVPVAAEVAGQWRGLTGEPQALAFRPVLEGTAVSYIAEAPAHDREAMVFEIEARPVEAGTPIAARLTRKFGTR